MSEYLIQGDTLSSIADAIRAKSGDSEAISAAAMADAIAAIVTGAELPDNVKEVKSGTFTPSSNTKSVYLDLWLPNTDGSSVSSSTGGLFVRWKTGANSSTSNYALLASFWNPFSTNLGGQSSYTKLKWGTAVKNGTAYHGNNYGACLTVGERGSTQVKMYLSSESSNPDVYFQAGATYEWIAWRYI